MSEQQAVDKSRGKKYEKVADRAARGDFEDLVLPLDFKILSFLPEVGELFAGLYPLGETVLNLSKKFVEVPGGLPTPVITSRLRVMKAMGLVAPTRSGVGSAGNHVWQRTAAGTKYINDQKKASNGTVS